MVDVYTKAERSRIMSLVKTRFTDPENRLASLLKKADVRYRRNVQTLPGTPDFVIPSAKTAIFVHGCFWHGHPNCKRAKLPETNKEFWEEKIGRNRRRDARVTRRLRRRGWHVMTVWQCRLRTPDRVVERLKTMLRE